MMMRRSRCCTGCRRTSLSSAESDSPEPPVRSPAKTPLLATFSHQLVGCATAERAAVRAGRLYFPPWTQRPEVGWEDTVHSFESHRWMWATLSQANRKRILQVPQHELLARAASDGPEVGGLAAFAM